MNKYPEHNQEYFYKFTAMETAFKILEGGKFRYSSPANFNDPFDLQTELYLEFAIADLPCLVMKAINTLVHGKRLVPINRQISLGKAILLLRKHHENGTDSKNLLDSLFEKLRPHLFMIQEEIEEVRRKYNDYWKDPLKTIKIFCVSEDNKNILLWSHYADNHKGVCFKLKVMPEKDNPICAAKKVNYLPKPPSFLDYDKLINLLASGDLQAWSSELYRQYPLAKSDIWNYEREWRVWAPFEKNRKAYLDIPIVDGEIDSIYFGIKADTESVHRLINIAQAKNIRRFFLSEKKKTEYGLTYKAI